jgi:hypothetical protein
MYRHLVLGERPKAQAYRWGFYWLEGAKDADYGVVGIASGKDLAALIPAAVRRTARGCDC